jgi:hypothetical protein
MHLGVDMQGRCKAMLPGSAKGVGMEAIQESARQKPGNKDVKDNKDGQDNKGQ